MSRKSWLALTGLSLFALSGCEAEVGEEYTGEALLRIRGTVRTNVAADADAVLALSEGAPEGTYVIDGVVTGDFPSEFEFAVTEPPPRTEPVAWGDLASPPHVVDTACLSFVMVPREHSSFVPVSPSPGVGCGSESVSDPNDPELVTTTQYFCRSSNDPEYERHLSCRREACEILASEGDASIREAPLSERTFFRTGMQRIDGLYSDRVFFDRHQPGQYFREARRCNTSALGEYDYVTLGGIGGPIEILRCTLESESGDTSIIDSIIEQELSLPCVESNFDLVYVSEDVMTDYKAGYNVVKDFDSVDSWLGVSTCVADRAILAFAAYNQEHGTSYPPFPMSSELAGQASVQEIGALLEEIESPCYRDAGAGVVTDPENADLTIEIVGKPWWLRESP